MKQSVFAKWITVIAGLHLIFAGVIFSSQWLSIIADGFFATVGPDHLQHSLAFWFAMFSLPMLMLAVALWGRAEQVRPALVWLALAGSVLGGSMIPASGFWTLTLLSLVALYQQHKVSLMMVAD